MYLRICIVDDSKFMRNLLHKMFTEFGYSVVGEASNGKEGVQIVNELSPDLVTLDITMPEMNGIEALEEIKKLHPSTKVIMVSSLNSRQQVLEAVEKGASDFIMKPFDKNTFHEMLKKIL